MFALQRIRFLMRQCRSNKTLENSVIHALASLSRNSILDFEREFCQTVYQFLELNPVKVKKGPFTRGDHDDR